MTLKPPPPAEQPQSEHSHPFESKPKNYASGNAVVRSCAHSLRRSKTRDKDPGPKIEVGKQLPDSLRKKIIFPYDTETCDLRKEVKRILRQDFMAEIIGSWKDEKAFESGLEYFSVLRKALLKKTSKKAEASLSDIVQEDKLFLDVFDNFVQSFVLPKLKRSLIENDAISDENIEVSFFYQRPPTIRIQPGPSSQHAPKHCDAQYGHQDGEINFWIPLTDRHLTETDLYVESAPGKEDYTPLDVNFGEVASFHGTSLRHYVPPNVTKFTRVSLDFRVGIEGYFDAKWRMRGTVNDHNRAVFAV